MRASPAALFAIFAIGAAAAAPASAAGAARAAVNPERLVLGAEQPQPGMQTTGARLDLPPLVLGVAPLEPFAMGSGAGGPSPNALLALLLGIIPGFGLGHVVANSSRWATWLVIDVVLLVAYYVLASFVPFSGGLFRLLFQVAVVVERVYEGVDAFQSASGRRHAALGVPEGGFAALASPLGARGGLVTVAAF